MSVGNDLVELVARYSDDPLGYSRVMYPWGEGVLANNTGPRKWQSEVLAAITEHLQGPDKFKLLRIAISSGRGIGKSGLLGMITQWGMSTCVDTKIVVTANTDRQLRTKTFPEIIKWFKFSANSHWFKSTATSITSVYEGHEESWRTDAYPWSVNNTEAFQGLHNYGRRIIVVFDESSSIDDQIWDVTEGSFTDENTQMIWIAFSNPTRSTGRFRECFGDKKAWWKTWQIDSRNVEGTSKDYSQQLIDYYGEDSDHVRVHVKGEFPRVGTMQFIPSDVVEACRKIEPVAVLSDPLIMSVDVARFGEDSTVIVIRRGKDARSIPWVVMRGADTMSVAARVMELQELYHCDAIFVDGGGVGGGVIDRLMMFKLPVIEVQFGAKADRGSMTREGAIPYANKRSEMWGYMRDWLKSGGAIPDDKELADELVNVQYGYQFRDGRDAIILEKKEDMKKRGVGSPDKADALAISFAYPVYPTDHAWQFNGGSGGHQIEYDAFSRDRVRGME